MNSIINKTITDKQLKGMLLEMAVSQALDILGIQHIHNDWDNYARMNGGVDIITDEWLIECKNWTYKTNVDMETLKTEVVDRFIDSDSKNMLVISCIGSGLILRLKKFSIQVVTLGTDVTPNNYSSIVNLLLFKLSPLLLKKPYIHSNSLYGSAEIEGRKND